MDGKTNASKELSDLNADTIELIQIIADSHEALNNTFRIINDVEPPVAFVPSNFMSQAEKDAKQMHANLDSRQILHCSQAKMEIQATVVKKAKYTIKYNVPEGGFIDQ